MLLGTRYRATERDTIEFEDLVTSEKRASATQAKKQVVTEAERELLRSGKFDELVEKQRRIDAERDAELRRQEEKLRREEEAYFTAKREAAKRTKQLSSSVHQVSLEVERYPQSQSQPDVVIHHQPRTAPTSLITTPLTTQTTVTQLMSSPSQDEEDFDQFLESVKARQLSITSKETLGGTTSSSVSGVTGGEGGEDDEVDFGYWEKAELPAREQSPAVTDPHTPADPPLPLSEAGDKGTALPASLPRDMDLSLL
jgi:hypothetical protein